MPLLRQGNQFRMRSLVARSLAFVGIRPVEPAGPTIVWERTSSLVCEVEVNVVWLSMPFWVSF